MDPALITKWLATLTASSLSGAKEAIALLGRKLAGEKLSESQERALADLSANASARDIVVALEQREAGGRGGDVINVGGRGGDAHGGGRAGDGGSVSVGDVVAGDGGRLGKD